MIKTEIHVFFVRDKCWGAHYAHVMNSCVPIYNMTFSLKQGVSSDKYFSVYEKSTLRILSAVSICQNVINSFKNTLFH